MAVNPVINISIPQGSDFSETFVSTESDGSASNLAGYSAAAKMKKHNEEIETKKRMAQMSKATRARRREAKRS